LRPPTDRDPIGQCGIDDGKIEHIDHFSVKERRVSSAGWEKRSYCMITAMAEDQSVKSAVEDVSQCTGQDEREAPNQPGMGRFGPHPEHVNGDHDNGNDPEYAQDQFPEGASECDAECHPLIFGKMKNKPIAQHMDLFPDGHMGFDPEFEHLVGDQHQKNNQDCFLQGLSLVKLGFDAECGVRYALEPFFRNELACHPADAVGLVLDAKQGIFQVVDKLLLA